MRTRCDAATPLLELTRAAYVMGAWDVIAFAVWAAVGRRRR